MSFDISRMSNALIIISCVVCLITIVLLFFVILSRKRHNFYLKEKELIESQYAQILLQSRLEIQEETFTQISYEIHDNIIQVLSLARLNLNTFGPKLTEEQSQSIDELLGSAIGDLRTLSHNLNTEYIKEEGLVNTMKKLLLTLHKTGKYQTTLICPETPALKEDTAIIIFRMFQETINNITKHANATTILVRIETIENKVKTIIQDNGKGFDVNAITSYMKGVGIKNIMNRGKMIGAEVSFKSSQNQGTAVTIIVPI
jgi:signal transduction histidine kinase